MNRREFVLALMTAPVLCLPLPRIAIGEDQDVGAIGRFMERWVCAHKAGDVERIGAMLTTDFTVRYTQGLDGSEGGGSDREHFLRALNRLIGADAPTESIVYDIEEGYDVEVREDGEVVVTNLRKIFKFKLRGPGGRVDDTDFSKYPCQMRLVPAGDGSLLLAELIQPLM